MTELTITQTSQKYHLKPATLRYYEQIGLLTDVPRHSNGNRYYDDQLQQWIEMIVCLRHSGVPVDVLVEYAELLKQGDSTLQAREDLLKDQLAVLKEKRHNLDRSIQRLEHKISLYESGEIKQQKSYFDKYRILDD